MRFASAAFGHGQVADEIGEPGERAALELGMFVPEMIDIPGFIGDDEIIISVFDQLLKHHEIGDQYLVHAAQCLKDLKIVLAAFAFDMT